MKISIGPGPTLWHRQLFTLHYEAAGAKAVIIRYHNGNVKPWYLRTDRSHRFRRWWWKKPADSFSSLANLDRPAVTFWVVKSWFRWPEKMTFVLPVAKRLDLRDHDLTERLDVILTPAPKIIRESKAVWKPLGIRVHESSISQLSGVRLAEPGITIAPYFPPAMKGMDEN